MQSTSRSPVARRAALAAALALILGLFTTVAAPRPASAGYEVADLRGYWEGYLEFDDGEQYFLDMGITRQRGSRLYGWVGVEDPVYSLRSGYVYEDDEVFLRIRILYRGRYAYMDVAGFYDWDTDSIEGEFEIWSGRSTLDWGYFVLE